MQRNDATDVLEVCTAVPVNNESQRSCCVRESGEVEQCIGNIEAGLKEQICEAKPAHSTQRRGWREKATEF